MVWPSTDLMIGDAYSWRQDLNTVRLSIVVPRGTRHTQLRLRLADRRITLQIDGGAVLLRRRTYAAIDPHRTRAYTLHDDGTRAEVRVIVFKRSLAGWSRLFVGDAHLQQLEQGKSSSTAADASLSGHGCASAVSDWCDDSERSREVLRRRVLPLQRQTWRRLPLVALAAARERGPSAWHVETASPNRRLVISARVLGAAESKGVARRSRSILGHHNLAQRRVREERRSQRDDRQMRAHALGHHFLIRRHPPCPPYVAPRFPHMS